MKVQVRKCPVTGKLFERDQDYAQHLVKTRVLGREKRAVNRFIQELNHQRQLIKNQCLCPSQLFSLVQDQWH